MTHSDDGCTGTNFDRPNFKQLESLLEDGKIGTVIVKDMSRFGRDYLRVGYFLDVIFPLKDTRFIAINDNVDSNKGLDDLLPFKNIMNEWYARDTSKKIRASIKAKAENGEHICYHPPYGYLRNPENPKQWIVDEEAALTIGRIFEMYISGKGVMQIANILTSEKILNPTSQKAKLGFNTIHKVEGDCWWYENTVAQILDTKEYLGCTISFKTYRKSYRDKKIYINDESNHLVFENTHEAIIDKNTFELAQKLRETKRKPNRYNTPDLFIGLLFCSDCEAKLYQRRYPNPSDNYYYCSSYKNRKNCSLHNTKTDRLLEKTFTAIKIISEIVLMDEQNFIDKISVNRENNKNHQLSFLVDDLTEKQTRISELQKIFKNLYADNIAAKITDTQFNQLYEIHNTEFLSLNIDVAEISKQIDSIKNNQINIEKFISAIKSYSSINDASELTVTLLNELIDKIVCHEPTGIGKKRTQRLDIHWNGVGYVDFSLLK